MDKAALEYWENIEAIALRNGLFKKNPSGCRFPPGCPGRLVSAYEVQSSSFASLFKEEEQSMKNTVVFRTEKG